MLPSEIRNEKHSAILIESNTYVCSIKKYYITDHMIGSIVLSK